MGLKFEWDKKKASSNLKKHDVGFDEASTVFRDPLASVFDDEEHSGNEDRQYILLDAHHFTDCSLSFLQNVPEI